MGFCNLIVKQVIRQLRVLYVVLSGQKCKDITHGSIIHTLSPTNIESSEYNVFGKISRQNLNIVQMLNGYACTCLFLVDVDCSAGPYAGIQLGDANKIFWDQPLRHDVILSQLSHFQDSIKNNKVLCKNHFWLWVFLLD